MPAAAAIGYLEVWVSFIRCLTFHSSEQGQLEGADCCNSLYADASVISGIASLDQRLLLYRCAHALDR
jgi:hypothetical protein